MYLNVKINGDDYIFDTESLGKTSEIPFFQETAEYLLTLQNIDSHGIAKYRNYFNYDSRGFERSANGYGRIVIPLEKEFEKVEASAIYYVDGERKVATTTYSSGISTVGEDPAANVNIMYDLTGRRVDSTSLQPGIYIRDGKKILVN